MKWLAGGIAYACIAIYVLVNLFGALIAALVHLLLLAGLGIVGHLVIKMFTKSNINEPDEPVPKHHEK